MCIGYPQGVARGNARGFMLLKVKGGMHLWDDVALDEIFYISSF